MWGQARVLLVSSALQINHLSRRLAMGLTLLSGAPICMNNSFESQVWERSTLLCHILSPLWEGRILFLSETYKTDKRLKANANLQSWHRPSTSEVCGKMFVRTNCRANLLSHPLSLFSLTMDHFLISYISLTYRFIRSRVAACLTCLWLHYSWWVHHEKQNKTHKKNPS